MELELTLTERQREFVEATADEVFFGGAAGGGKSRAQLADALLWAASRAGSRQLLLRRTYPELERTLIPASRALFPRAVARYHATRHSWLFQNGSVVEFGHCAAEGDVTRYQSAEYDVIRFDELTHFTEYQYRYLLSRLRGANGFPKQMKSTGNPGGVGHDWVKRRFIDPRPPREEGTDSTGRRLVFLPARVEDNPFLTGSDPGYVRRLQALPGKERGALLEGDWNLHEGRFFPEFERSAHVVPAMEPPEHWRRYISIDYGLDMLACYWTAFDTRGRGIVYRELYEPGLIVSQAARRVLALTPKGERVERTLAPPDLWGRMADTGKSQAELFAENGLVLSRVSAERVAGWLNLREWLRPFPDETGKITAGLRVSERCVNLIRAMGALCCDPRRPGDCADRPHELTHAPDSLRYLLSGRPFGAAGPCDEERDYEDFLRFGTGRGTW